MHCNQHSTECIRSKPPWIILPANKYN